MRRPPRRLKAKRVTSSEGTHETRFGEENRKYWFSPEEISAALDPGVNQAQVRQLDAATRSAFDRRAGDAMDRLGYRTER